MRRKRFYLACFSLLLVLLALGDLQFGRGWLGILAELCAAAFLGWDACRNHRAYVAAGRPPERTVYPKTEAVIYGGVGLFLLGCVGTVAYVVKAASEHIANELFLLFAILTAVVLAMAAYSFGEAGRAWRQRRAESAGA